MADIRVSGIGFQVPDPAPLGVGSPPGSILNLFPVFPDVGATVSNSAGMCGCATTCGAGMLTPTLYLWNTPSQSQVNAVTPPGMTASFLPVR
jgi:hypothetical protein